MLLLRYVKNILNLVNKTQTTIHTYTCVLTFGGSGCCCIITVAWQQKEIFKR